jgi:hypothetical protein
VRSHGLCQKGSFGHVLQRTRRYSSQAVFREEFSGRLTYLIDQVTCSCRRRGIKKEHVFLGGEDANSFAENFVSTLRVKGWLVAGVNVHDDRKQQVNLQASTDRIDLMGIATILLNCRANCCPAALGIYRNLRILVRHQRKLVVMLTEVKTELMELWIVFFPVFSTRIKAASYRLHKAHCT